VTPAGENKFAHACRIGAIAPNLLEHGLNHLPGAVPLEDGEPAIVLETNDTQLGAFAIKTVW
jgi:hypothetical protein